PAPAPATSQHFAPPNKSTGRSNRARINQQRPRRAVRALLPYRGLAAVPGAAGPAQLSADHPRLS
ncbi:hypothetical protein ACFWA5_41370, partial [Streptomyces mirabilis]|uniref:hypothetical protein n=1 Tax=Streptomyces mirabilis TaxID=68239 RepID=UPI003663CD7A